MSRSATEGKLRHLELARAASACPGCPKLHQQLLLRRGLRLSRSSRIGSRASRCAGRVSRCAGRVASSISCLTGIGCGLTGRIRCLFGRVSSLVCSAATAAAGAQQKRRSEGAKSRFDLHLVTPKGLERFKNSRQRQTSFVSLIHLIAAAHSRVFTGVFKLRWAAVSSVGDAQTVRDSMRDIVNTHATTGAKLCCRAECASVQFLRARMCLAPFDRRRAEHQSRTAAATGDLHHPKH